MKPPIIVNDSDIPDRSGDVIFFETIEDVTRGIEPIDVINNVFAAAYDSEGRLLELKIEKSRPKGWWNIGIDKVIVSSTEQEAEHAFELRQLLVDFFTRVGIDQDWLSEATLEELVAKGMREFRG